MTTLDPRALKAARIAYQSAFPDGPWHADGGETDAPIRAAITAYLAASPQPANPAQVTDALDGFSQYRRKQIAELRPWVSGDDMSRISVSAPDKEAGSPKVGDMIARNPKNHDDQWLVAAAYFADNFEPLTAAIGAGRSSEPEFETAPDNGTPAEVLAYVLDCARRWVPEARIIGNARAGDIERAIAAIGAGDEQPFHLVEEFDDVGAQMVVAPAIGAGGQAVAVKPLEWSQRSQVMRTYFAADERGDLYWINNQSFDSDSFYFTTVSQIDGAILYDGDDLLAAKAAAQADYERRILSVIAHPVQPGWRLVPMTPTQEMMAAADRARPLPESYVYEIWGSMLSAAPQPKGE